MYVQAEKRKVNKSRGIAQNESSSKLNFGIMDNRPEAILQRKLQEMANDSPQLNQKAQLQAMLQYHIAQQPSPIQRKEATELPYKLKSGRVHLMDTISESLFKSVAQLKRAREDEWGKDSDSSSQLISLNSTAQLAVKASVPDLTPIVIDDENASDVGERGIIIRDSKNKPGCKVVRFNNEPDLLYRVYLHEMSPTRAHDKIAYGLNVAEFDNGTDSVRITADIDISDPQLQTAHFEAWNGKIKIGKLVIHNTADSFTITDIYTNLSPGHSVKGLGTLFLEITSVLAAMMGKETILLAANRQNMNEKHPAPFYAHFEFSSTDGIDHVNKAKEFGVPFESYLSMIGRTAIEMEGNAGKVGESTGAYLDNKHWK